MTRTVTALALVASVIGSLSFWSTRYREAEAWVAGRSIGLFTTSNSDGTYFFATHQISPQSASVASLNVSPECSTALLIAPLAIVAAWAMMMPRFRPAMIGAGMLAGLVMLELVGTLRLTMIGLAWHFWGSGSFWITHNLLGTVATIFSGVVAVAVQVKVLGVRTLVTGRRFRSAQGQNR
ncbi:MAG TPA: hypothetical protein VGP46_07180 [Acidimicrobiales bacterium]|nr:hypothetical protein [Acidimicrobiales bacterium]